MIIFWISTISRVEIIVLSAVQNIFCNVLFLNIGWKDTKINKYQNDIEMSYYITLLHVQLVSSEFFKRFLQQ